MRNGFGGPLGAAPVARRNGWHGRREGRGSIEWRIDAGAERDAGQTLDVVGRQFDVVAATLGARLTLVALAYEPVWAIGTGRTATPAEAQAVHGFLRQRLEAAGAGDVKVLYGGSVKAANAAELFAMPDIDGGLVGGASLDANEFLAIAAA